MISNEQTHGMAGAPAIDHKGGILGSIGQIYLDDRTGQPTWATVTTGPSDGFGNFIPLRDAQTNDGGVGVSFPYSAAVVAAAPRLAVGQHLDAQQELELHRYYGEHPSSSGVTSEADAILDVTPVDQPETQAERGAHGSQHDTDAGVMFLREEQLRTGTRRRESTKFRFRKVVVTEEKTITVSVRREELRVDRMDITGEHLGSDAEAVEQPERIMVLHEEVPVISMQARPVESVHITVEQIVDQQQVTGRVRQEHAVLEQNADPRPLR